MDKQKQIDEICKVITEGEDAKVSSKELRSICNYNEYGCESCGARVFCHEEKDK